MIIVGICGASGSGKSTLAREIKDNLNCSAVIMGQDCYYHDCSELPFEERVRINYDEPSIFNYDEMLADIMALSEGKSITKKGYDYANHMRADTNEVIEAPDVLIVEGIHMFFDERLRKAMSLKVYMHVDKDICLLRRVKRDIRQRGRTIENIATQYLATVKPMYEAYISKYINDADFAVMRGGKNRIAIDAIAAYISAKLLAERFEKEEQVAVGIEGADRGIL